MNILACAQNLLTYFSPEERSIPDHVDYPGCNAAVAKAMNDALQMLFGKGGKWVRNDERGATLHAPVTIPITVTNGSTAATIDGGDWQSWFSGCSIVIDGADVDNRIRNNSASVVLKYPWTGTSGTHGATIYHDSIDLAADVLEVHPEVLCNRRPLHPIADPASQSVTNANDYAHREVIGRPLASVTKTGTPQGYRVETWVPTSATPSRIRMRFAPAPSVASFVEYEVMLAPPVVTNIASTDELPIPFGFVESIFLPIAVKKLRACPFWRGIVGDDSVESGYRDALAMIEEGKPDKSGTITFRPPF